MSASPYTAIGGFYFFYFAFVGAFSPYWSLYLRHLGYAAVEIGLLMSLLQVMRIFAPNAWGWLADHTGRRVEIVRVAALLGLVGYVGVFFGESFGWMLLVMGAMSFFWSASLPLVEAVTFSHLGARTGGYGRIRSWGSVGFIAAVVGVGYLLDLVAITWLLWVVLALKLGVAGAALAIRDSSALRHDAEGAPLWAILRRPDVRALMAACFLMAAAHGPYYVFYSIFLVDAGYTKSAVGWLWALGVLSEIAVFFLMPRLTERFSGKQILVFSFGCAVARFLLVAWFVDVLALVLLSQLLHAATFGSYHAAAVASFHRHFGGRHQAKGQALYTSVSFGAGGTIGSVLSGFAWETIGPNITFTLCSLAALGGGALLAWKLGPERACV
ncbi:MAG: MFS transporter [Pseudomonadota bacterium]